MLCGSISPIKDDKYDGSCSKMRLWGEPSQIDATNIMEGDWGFQTTLTRCTYSMALVWRYHESLKAYLAPTGLVSEPRGDLTCRGDLRLEVLISVPSVGFIYFHSRSAHDDPPPYRGLCLLCLLKLGRVIRCVYNCVMAYGTFHYVIMHYQPF